MNIKELEARILRIEEELGIELEPCQAAKVAAEGGELATWGKLALKGGQYVVEELSYESDPKEEVHEALTLEDMWDWCVDINAAKEFEPHKDVSGATYTGHDEEDVPGTARKGEN